MKVYVRSAYADSRDTSDNFSYIKVQYGRYLEKFGFREDVNEYGNHEALIDITSLDDLYMLCDAIGRVILGDNHSYDTPRYIKMIITVDDDWMS